MTKVLQRFGMESAKLVGSTLPTNCKLSKDQCPKSKTEKAEMSKVPYASVVGSLMYVVGVRLRDVEETYIFIRLVW